MPHTKIKTASFEALSQTAKPQTCRLKGDLDDDGGDDDSDDGPPCEGPNEGSGIISPGQRHLVVRMKFGNRKRLKVRFCSIECYDEYYKELTNED